MRILIIHHADCPDGMAAAWVAHNTLGERAELIPAAYGDEPPDVTGALVYIVDFSYPRDVLLQMVADAQFVTVYDHHKTAKADLEGLKKAGLRVVFDMERSGAQIVWDEMNVNVPRPALVEYVADRDLWKWKLPGSREVSAYISSRMFTLGEYGRMADDMRTETGLNRIKLFGKVLHEQYWIDVDAIVRGTRRKMKIGGHIVPVANGPRRFSSDVAGSMAFEQPFAASYVDVPEGRAFSLRVRDSEVDVSEIARAMGKQFGTTGGGHAAAAGFLAPHGWEGE